MVRSGRKTLYDVILPGTHDSGAYEIPLRWTTPTGAPAVLAAPPLRWFLRRTLRDFSRTQSGPVLEQLRAGARYQDFRVSLASHPAPPDAGRFWLVHGAVACVPLADALADMAAFTQECAARGQPHTPIVTVCRILGPGWDDDSRAELASMFTDALGEENVYNGSPAELRSVAYSDLPPHVVAGVPGIGSFPPGIQFGSDIWINTYSLEAKEAGLEKQLGGIEPRGKRTNLYALGWTVTPQPADIAKRIISLGIARPSLEEEAVRFNKRFPDFAKRLLPELRNKCNVVMFDFITPELAQAVLALNED